MSITPITDVDPLLYSALSAPELQALIDRVEESLLDRFNFSYDQVNNQWDEVTDQQKGGGKNVFVKAKIASISGITEHDLGQDPVTVDATFYHLWSLQGRIERTQGNWQDVVNVTYRPDLPLSKWAEVVISLVRLQASRSGMKSESIAGSHSYQSQEWDEAIVKAGRKLGFIQV